MSFGGFGFGQNNNQQQTPTFGGGFGANTNTNTGFGATNNTGFGSTNNTGGGLFGGGGTSTGFGATGGFGATNSAFGAKPATGGFGAPATTSSGGLFGNNTATAGGGFGGFGATNATTPSFGATNTGGGLFGSTANKPAFGAPASSSPFGGGAATTGFGAPATGAFGAPASTALGQGVGDCQGTGNTPFQAFVEKEPNSSTNQQNAFQNICFQQPYQKFSPEELRLADYNQGRRYGNGNNQVGAFGATNFGGFGATTNTGFGAANTTTASSGGLFGTTNTTSPFGTSQPASTGFGTNTATAGGGLFGQKPATTGGLFGAQPAAQPSGGLFGGTGGTGFGASATGGFGTPNAANTSLFGNNNAPKPGGFTFGTTPASTTTGFGAAPATTGAFGGGLFGTNAGSTQNTTTGFGAQPTNTSNPFGGGFGNNTQQQPATTSLFGNNANQNKPTSLFGSNSGTTGGGLFGSAQPAANTTGFGATNTASTGLFGAPKPATTGLFGGTSNTQTNTGGGLFGGSFGTTQTQPQQQQQSSLFGGLNTNNNNQQKPSLFGGTGTQQQGGGGLFNNPGSQQQGSLFGGMNNSQQGQQQQPQNSMFGGNSSLFGNSQQGQQSQSLTASINDATALGGSFFAGLGTSQAANPGPLATPLSSSIKAKKSAALPMYKLNSASASRFATPQKQRGFGFSYSNYNSPSSASSTASTPGTFGGSLLSVGSGNTFGRGLSKSISTSSLRRSFSTEDSILAPGAFSASPSARQFGSTGSVKKLTISRNLRQDLFSPPNSQSQPSSAPLGGILKKRVSFDSNVNNNTNNNSSPLKQVNNAAPSAEELGYMRPSLSSGAKSSGTSSAPEMEQVSNANNQLAIVREEEPLVPAHSSDDAEGEYWMTPTLAEIEAMSHDQKRRVNLTVGRHGAGKVTFNVPVDLTDVPINEIIDKIVILKIRSCTVYADTARKPPMGKGLNVPSTITLLQTWPRGCNKENPATPREAAKHLKRLKSVPDTTFESFDSENGIWTFSVEHFTTYGLAEDEDDDEFGQSTLSLPPDSPTPKMRNTPRSFDQSFASTSHVTESDPEDTFEFRRKKVLPGAFDSQAAFLDDEPDQEYNDGQNSFLDERSMGSQSESGVDEPMEEDDVFQDDESVSIQDQDMAGAYPEADNTMEQMDEDSQEDNNEMELMAQTPGAIMRARMRAIRSGTPMKQRFAAGDDWADTLTATVSPKKQDRALLKSLIDLNGNDSRPEGQPTSVQRRVVSTGQGFATSIDLMNSLFGQARSPVKVAKVPAVAKGFEWPYAKRTKTAGHDTSNMSVQDRAFHDSMKPSWGFEGTLVYAAPSNVRPFGRSSRRARERDGLLNIQKGGIVSENRDVRLAKFSNEAAADLLKIQKELTVISTSGDTPFAHLEPESFSFLDFSNGIQGNDAATAHEKLVWRLAGVLFDPIEIPPAMRNVPNIDQRLRKDKLSSFWLQLVDDASTKGAMLARTNEEKAIAYLSGHKVEDACDALLKNRDFHLATLVSLIGSGKPSMRKDMREQLSEWQKSRMLSEFSEPIRAIYELLAGNVCVCDGAKGPEDRMESFIISKRFGLDWRRAFGLRLWYGIPSNEPLEAAVEQFAEELSQDKETSSPDPWYVEQKVPTLWDDRQIRYREDLLWGLLKLYTFDNVDPEETLRPENSQLSPLDSRLSWQLNQALSGAPGVPIATDDGERSDRLTLSFASQLVNEGSWLDAIFVLLHLTIDDARAKCIQDHLAYNAGKIGENSQAFATLAKTYKIPEAWIWEAKALYMRSVEKNPRAEVECLTKAGSFNEAHRTFVKEVAPKAIVELEYDALRVLLQSFEGKNVNTADWTVGGQIYQDYLYLLDCDKKAGAIDKKVLSRLLSNLPSVVAEERHPGFMETVAVETMSGVVAKAVIALSKQVEQQDITKDIAKVLKLPLTEDKYLKHSVELSLQYYRGIMTK